MQAFQHRHAETDVRHKMAVHHVIMQHLRTGIQHHLAVIAKVGKVGRKNGRTNNRHLCYTLRNFQKDFCLSSSIFFRFSARFPAPDGREHSYFLVYMKTRKKSNPTPCFSRKEYKNTENQTTVPFREAVWLCGFS